VKRPRVLLADDHRIVGEGLKSLLANDFELVAIVEDGREMVAATRKLQPDVIVADISMPRLNGIEALTQLKKELPEVKVVLLTMHNDPAYARRALEAGAKGFVVKYAVAAELVMAINAAVKGQTFVTPSLAGHVMRQMRLDEISRPLTGRQREILEMLSEGHSAKQIAAALAISPRTVQFHKYQIMEAHGLHSNAELFHFAIKHGIVSI
jgi:DNA-binding NarL/FixJ family response regulator